MILKWRSFSLFRFSRKLVPKLHKFIDEVFGSLFPAYGGRSGNHS